jgi:2-polyprenyl-3-methyl-5-hydroxy-6-metoxy-1,4-benzoquinol methylase
VVNLTDTLRQRNYIQRRLRKYSDKELVESGIFLRNSAFSFFREYWLRIARVGKLLSTKEIAGERVSCPVCMTKVLEESQKLSASLKYSYRKCKSCGLGILCPFPSKDEVGSAYDSEEYFESLSKPVDNALYQWLLTRRIHLTPSEWMIRSFVKGKILDVGCGNGEFLNNLKRSGWSVYGNDISNIAKRNTESKIGTGRVKIGVFPRLNYSSKFDYVSFWHVLEHLRDPSLYAIKAYRVLNDGGMVVGEVPNFDSVWLKLFKNYYCWIIVPEHLLYFSKESLVTLLKKAGFHSVEVFTPAKGLLNLSFSLKKFLMEKRVSGFFVKPFFVLSFPVSIVLTLIFSLFQKGEVLRFSARK